MNDIDELRAFRVHDAGLRALGLTGPRTVPWHRVEPLRESCQRLHGQTLERLDERGGLSPGELYIHVRGLKRFDIPTIDVVRDWFVNWVKED